MKLLTFDGPGHVLDVPGLFTLELGASIEIDDDLAETLVRANPTIRLTVADIAIPPESAPEAAARGPAGRGARPPTPTSKTRRSS